MESIEFYNTPEGDVMYKPIGEAGARAYRRRVEIVIEEMLDVIKNQISSGLQSSL